MRNTINIKSLNIKLSDLVFVEVEPYPYKSIPNGVCSKCVFGNPLDLSGVNCFRNMISEDQYDYVKNLGNCILHGVNYGYYMLKKKDNSENKEQYKLWDSIKTDH